MELDEKPYVWSSQWNLSASEPIYLVDGANNVRRGHIDDNAGLLHVFFLCKHRGVGNDLQGSHTHKMLYMRTKEF